MALPMPIPPWLVTRPAEHQIASSAGLREGLAAAHIWAQANEEKARLEQAARRQNLEAALEAERLQEKSIYDAQKLAADVAYNKASISEAQAKIGQTQANAERAARQWAAQHQLAQQREARRVMAAGVAEQRETRQGEQFAASNELAKQRAAETERHNLAMENRTKGVPEDEALAAYAKSKREPQPESGGILGGIKRFFSGEPAKVGESPHAEGEYIRNKKDGKLYVVRNGLPVLVDDKTTEEEP